MTKIQKISKNITPFAGVFYVNDEYKRCGLGKLIDNQLGIRISTKGYSYGNLIGNFFNLRLSGGECAEDIQKHFRRIWNKYPAMRLRVQIRCCAVSANWQLTIQL